MKYEDIFPIGLVIGLVIISYYMVTTLLTLPYSELIKVLEISGVCVLAMLLLIFAIIPSPIQRWIDKEKKVSKEST